MCSSDLRRGRIEAEGEETRGEVSQRAGEAHVRTAVDSKQISELAGGDQDADRGSVADDDGAGEIGRASCRERVLRLV